LSTSKQQQKMTRKTMGKVFNNAIAIWMDLRKTNVIFRKVVVRRESSLPPLDSTFPADRPFTVGFRILLFKSLLFNKIPKSVTRTRFLSRERKTFLLLVESNE
jgi:hypothetical protein